MITYMMMMMMMMNDGNEDKVMLLMIMIIISSRIEAISNLPTPPLQLETAMIFLTPLSPTEM
jgi:hypothetical protein